MVGGDWVHHGVSLGEAERVCHFRVGSVLIFGGVRAGRRRKELEERGKGQGSHMNGFLSGFWGRACGLRRDEEDDLGRGLSGLGLAGPWQLQLKKKAGGLGSGHSFPIHRRHSPSQATAKTRRRHWSEQKEGRVRVIYLLVAYLTSFLSLRFQLVIVFSLYLKCMRGV